GRSLRSGRVRSRRPHGPAARAPRRRTCPLRRRRGPGFRWMSRRSRAERRHSSLAWRVAVAPFEHPVGTVGQWPEEQQEPRYGDAPPGAEHGLGEVLERSAAGGGERGPIGNADREAEQRGAEVEAQESDPDPTAARLAFEPALEKGADD